MTKAPLNAFLTLLLLAPTVLSLPHNANAQESASFLLMRQNSTLREFSVAKSNDIAAGNLTVPTSPCFTTLAPGNLAAENRNFFGDEAVAFDGATVRLFDTNSCVQTDSFTIPNVGGTRQISGVERDENSGTLITLVADGAPSVSPNAYVYELQRGTGGSTTLRGSFDLFIYAFGYLLHNTNSLAFNGQEVLVFVYRWGLGGTGLGEIRSANLTTGLVTPVLSLPTSVADLRVGAADFHPNSGLYLFDSVLSPIVNTAFSTALDPNSGAYAIYKNYSGTNISSHKSFMKNDKRYTVEDHGGSVFKPAVYDISTGTTTTSPYSISCMIVGNLTPGIACPGSGWSVIGIAN